MRKYYWYISGYARKHGLVILTSVVFAIVFFSLFIPRFINLVEHKERVYIGIVGSYSLEEMPEQITKLVSVGLTDVEKDGTISPSVAERWIVEDDGKTYRFVVKKNLVWQDGKALTTSDLSYNFKDVEVITTPNEIVFKLPEPFVPFPSVVTKPLFRYQEQRHSLFLKRRIPIGLSSYQITDYTESNGKLSEVVVDSAQQRRIFRFYLTEEQAVTAYKHGKVDILTDLSSRYDVFDWSTSSVAENVRTDRYIAVFLDNANPLFNKGVRQALSYALPKPTDQTRALSPISPDSWVYLNSSKSYDYDQERALERIFSEIPPQPLTFELVTTANLQTQAEQIKQAWETFGQTAYDRCQSNDDIKDKNQCNNVKIAISIRVSTFPDVNNYQAMLVSQHIPPDPDQYYLWHSEQQSNFAHFKNTRIDSLLERGRTTAEAEERKAIYQEFQQFFLEDAPAIFIQHPTSYEVSRK